MPFGDYESWEDCIERNKDAADPSAYCGKIKHQIEDKAYGKMKLQKDYDSILMSLTSAIEGLIQLRDSIIQNPDAVKRPALMDSGAPDLVFVDRKVHGGEAVTAPAEAWAIRRVEAIRHVEPESEDTAGKADDHALRGALKIDILQKDARTRRISGWASVELVDRQKELVSIDAFTDDVLRKFLERSGGRIYLQHQDIAIAKVDVLERRMRPDGNLGLWVEAQMFKLDSIDDAVWDAVENGDLSGFSIKGKAVGKERQCTPELCYAYVPGIELYGISAVDRPANPESLIVQSVQKAVRAGRVPAAVLADIRKEDTPTPKEPTPPSKPASKLKPNMMELLRKKWGLTP